MARTRRPEPRKFRSKWRIRWTDEHGRRRGEVYDSFADADFALDRHLLDVEQTKRGLRRLSLPDKTFDQLCDHWLKARATRKRSGAKDESIIRAHLRPAFRRFLVRDVSLDLVDEFIYAREHLNQKTINNHLTLLIAMLNEAKERGWVRDVPRIRKFKIQLFDKDYSWLHDRSEIARFLQAARAEEDPAVFVLYATAIYTGMRAGELGGLCWRAVNFDRRLITVETSFGRKTKGGDVRYVPILDPLLPVLRDWKLRMPGLLVFPNGTGNMRQEADRIFQETLHRVLTRANFPNIERGGRTRRFLVFHDLRHTFASHWMMDGGDIFKLQKILGHKSLQMTQRYAHLAPEAFAGDFSRLGSSIPATGAVTPLRTTAPGTTVQQVLQEAAP